MEMRRNLTLAGLVACVTFATGCFNIEQGLKLNKDMSGEVGFSMTMDMEPMVLVMMSMQREMSGQKGDPTPAEIEKAKKDFLASGKTKTTQNLPQKAEMEKNLPPGVRLLDTSVKEDGLKMTAKFNFAFDNVSKLSQIQMPSKAEAGPGPKNPFEQPFPFEIKDEGGTLLLTMETKNPVAEQKAETAQMKLDSGLQKKIEEAFKSLRVAFKLETPLTVVDHNATKKDGQTLYWEYDLKTMEKMTPEQLAQGVRVRLRK
jgi:hypothetical protein